MNDPASGPPSPPIITADYLRSLGADEDCELLEAYEDEWPAGAALTAENVKRALDMDLDPEWLLRRLLEIGPWRQYLAEVAAMEAEYLQRLDQPIDAEYWRRQVLNGEEYHQRQAAIIIRYLTEALVAGPKTPSETP